MGNSKSVSKNASKIPTVNKKEANPDQLTLEIPMVPKAEHEPAQAYAC
jgi:hypothetical protein